MKSLVSILLLSLFLSACGRIEHFQNLAQQKIEPSEWETGELEQPETAPILSITEDARGMWGIEGKSLFFNLYDNGIIEFDFPDEQKKKPGKNSYKAEEIYTLRRARISREELRQFIELLKSESLQNAQGVYTRKCCCTDAALDYKIFYQSGTPKNISLENYCGFNELTKPDANFNSNFPQALPELLNLIERTKARQILEKSSNKPK